MLLALAACGCGGEPVCTGDARPHETAAAEIETMLAASAGAWNRGDLAGFLDGYLDSPATSFAGANGVIHGLEDIRARYERAYWAPGAARDALRFELLAVRSLGACHALALGRYVLYNPARDSTTGRGVFSLVLERTGAGWKITHDHTSASPEPTETPPPGRDPADDAGRDG